MAFASTGPTQIGNTRSCASSRRMMIGRLVSGSTMRPFTAISMSIGVLCFHPASQAVWRGFGDAHRYEPANPLDRSREVYRRPPSRSAGQLGVPAAGPGLDQNLHDLADLRLVEPELNLSLQGLQGNDAGRFLRLEHVIGHPLDRQCVRSRRVLERVDEREADLADQAHRVVEVASGLAGEAYDHVG